MKSFSIKIFTFALIIFSAFNPLFGIINQSKAQQDMSSPGAAVGKATGAAAACFLSIELQKLAKEPLDQAKALADPGAVGSKAAVAGVGAGAGGGGLAVADVGTHIQNVSMAASLASISQSVAAVGTKQGTNSTLSESQKCLRDTVVKILGDYIVDQTITWIQGGGKPKFVQNWNSFFKDAVNAGVGEVIKESGAAFLCEPFKFQVKISLYPVQRFKQKIDCTLDKVVGNINNFMNDFTQGSWVGYGSLWAPNNNYFGQILLTYDESSQRASAKKEAAQNEALAGGGFLSVQKCVQKNQAEISSCLSECQSFDPVTGDNVNSCGEGNVRSFCEEHASCDKYEATTPGSAVASMAIKSLDWDLTYLSMTQSWVASLTNAVVNRVITQGLSIMTQSNSPDTNVNVAISGANAAISPEDISAAASGLLQNIQGLKAGIVNNEQIISATKSKSLLNMDEIYKIYSTCSGVPGGAAATASSTATQLRKDIKLINDTYVLANSQFKIEVDYLSSQVIALSAADFQKKYEEFVNKYQDPIRDANSQAGQMEANQELQSTRAEFSAAEAFTSNAPCTPDQFAKPQ